MKKVMKNIGVLVAASAVAAMSVVAVDAATTTDTFTATIIIQDDCDIVSVANLDFGTQGVLAANVDATAALSVQCTTLTNYNIGLDAGTTSGGSLTTRKMTSGSADIDYEMYSDSGRTANWGTASVTSVGTGSAQTFTIYGRVPVQATPAVGTYTDTVTVTVTF